MKWYEYGLVAAVSAFLRLFPFIQYDYFTNPGWDIYLRALRADLVLPDVLGFMSTHLNPPLLYMAVGAIHNLTGVSNLTLMTFMNTSISIITPILVFWMLGRLYDRETALIGAFLILFLNTGLIEKLANGTVNGTLANYIIVPLFIFALITGWHWTRLVLLGVMALATHAIGGLALIAVLLGETIHRVRTKKDWYLLGLWAIFIPVVAVLWGDYLVRFLVAFVPELSFSVLFILENIWKIKIIVPLVLFFFIGRDVLSDTKRPFLWQLGFYVAMFIFFTGLDPKLPPRRWARLMVVPLVMLVAPTLRRFITGRSWKHIIVGGIVILICIPQMFGYMGTQLQNRDDVVLATEGTDEVLAPVTGNATVLATPLTQQLVSYYTYDGIRKNVITPNWDRGEGHPVLTEGQAPDKSVEYIYIHKKEVFVPYHLRPDRYAIDTADWSEVVKETDAGILYKNIHAE